MAGTDTRAATEHDLIATMGASDAHRRIRALINELEERNRSAVREMETEAYWISRMREQTARHLDVLLQMKATLDAIQSWIGGD